jgi:hypothetical protein
VIFLRSIRSPGIILSGEELFFLEGKKEFGGLIDE